MSLNLIPSETSGTDRFAVADTGGGNNGSTASLQVTIQPYLQVCSMSEVITLPVTGERMVSEGFVLHSMRYTLRSFVSMKSSPKSSKANTLRSGLSWSTTDLAASEAYCYWR